MWPKLQGESTGRCAPRLARLACRVTTLRCSRCGRTANLDERGPLPGWTGALEETPLGVAAWASIDGVDVCPQCQTADERDSIRERILRAITSEVERSGNDVDPSGRDSAMINFAMNLIPTTPHSTEHQTAPATPTSQSGQQAPLMTAHVTGAFLTGRPVTLALQDYVRDQALLATRIREACPWDVIAPGPAENGTYETGGGFPTGLPMKLVNLRTADPQALAERLNTRSLMADSTRSLEGDLPDSLWSFEMGRVSIDFYDFGVATLDAYVSIGAPPGTSRERVASQLKRMVWLKPHDGQREPPGVSLLLARLVRDASERFARAVDLYPSDLRESPWLESILPLQHQSDIAVVPMWGKLLWLHPVVVQTGSATSSESETFAEGLSSPFHRNMAIEGGRFSAGIGSSAVVVADAGQELVALDLTALHWATYALFMEIDRGLARFLNLGAPVSKASLRSTERLAEQVFEYYARLATIRARVDSELAGLGGDRQEIWNTIAAVQNSDALLSGVDRKVGLVRDIAERRAQQVATMVARRAETFLGILTSLTLITLSIGILGNFIGALPDDAGTLTMRWGFFTAGVLAALGVMVFMYQGRRRKPRR